MNSICRTSQSVNLLVGILIVQKTIRHLFNNAKNVAYAIQYTNRGMLANV